MNIASQIEDAPFLGSIEDAPFLWSIEDAPFLWSIEDAPFLWSIEDAPFFACLPFFFRRRALINEAIPLQREADEADFYAH